MKLEPKTRNLSKMGRRFYTQMDMSILKHDIAINNSKIKRGERVDSGKMTIRECGCGVEGCFLIHHIKWVRKI